MSVFILRVIAMITMIIDHLGICFFNNAPIMRTIGRTAFILFSFLVAEGFYHIQNNRRKTIHHLLFLGCLAIVSEFAFDLFHYQLDFSKYFSKQNVIWQYLLVYIILLLSNKLKDVFRYLVILILAILTMLITTLCSVDYYAYGTFLVISFYFYYECCQKKVFSPLIKAITLFGIYTIFTLLLLLITQTGFTYPLILYRIGTLLPFILIFFFNDSIGYKSPWFRLLSKGFYPLHLFLLGILQFL